MGNINSNPVDQDLNAPLNENQAQDENRSDSETHTIMDEIVLASVNDLHEEYDRQENDNLRSKKLHFREEELEHINVMRNSNQSHLEAQIKAAEIENYEKQLKIIELEELLTNQQTRAEDLRKTCFHLEKNSQLEKMVLEARIRETEMKNNELNSNIKELEEVITNLESTEQEHLKIISDLATKALNQSRDRALLRILLNTSNEAERESSVNKRENIPSKNTSKKWKKGLLIGGACVVAAVALWKYGPRVAGIASGLTLLVGNLF